MGRKRDAKFEELKGLVLKEVERTTGHDEELIFRTECGKAFRMYHQQDCCESVTIEDIVGDLKDLVGSPILTAEERSNSGADSDNYGSETWTFYELATIKGSVTIRWYGASNGYYSESVDFQET